MANNNKIEKDAVYTVGLYLNKCPKLDHIINTNDKTPIYDGNIYAYNDDNHKIEKYFATVPLQVKGTTSTKNYYRIGRDYIEGYKKDKGCIFFLVQEKIQPAKVLYAILTPANLDQLLQQATKTIRINLKEVPTNPQKFETEIFTFAAKRNGEKVENSSHEEIEDLVKSFEEIRGYLNEIKDKDVKIELELYLDSIKDLKADDTIGWRDKFIFYSRKALDLAANNLKYHDFTHLQHNFGFYLQKQKQFHLVEDYYVKALKVLRYFTNVLSIPAFNSNLAATLNNLAALHKDLIRYQEAEQEYQEALEIYRRLADTNRDVYIGGLATILNNLGELHRILTRYQEAEQEYQEALAIYRKLAATNRDTYIGYVAMTLNNLGLLHETLTRYQEAGSEYQEALKIYRRLAKTNRDAYIKEVAWNLKNLASLHGTLTRYEEAEQEYQEALEYYGELANANRDAYIIYKARTLNNLGNLHKDLKSYNEAEQEYQEALIIYREQVGINRDAYSEDEANTLINLAILYKILTRYEDAEQEYLKALDIFRKLVTTNREAYNKGLANVLVNLGNLHRILKHNEEAEKELQEALNIFRELAATNRDANIEYVALTLFNLALLLFGDNKRMEEARDVAKEAHVIFTELANRYPQIWNNYLAATQLLLEEPKTL